MQRKRIRQRDRRHKRIRKKIFGTKERPRLCVYRSLKHLSAQIVVDDENKTIVSISTFAKDGKGKISYGGNVKAARELGRLLAEKAVSKGLRNVVFDRGGYQFHGRIKAFVESARKSGLAF